MKEENGYIILESKMNNLSINELHSLNSNIDVILNNRLNQIKSKSNLAHTSVLNKIGQVLLQAVNEKPAEAFNLPRGVSFDVHNQCYIFQVFVDKKRKTIKRSVKYDVVMKAYKDFHNEKSKKTTRA